MTKAALVALHSRKLTNIRNQAVEHLEMMRKAVQAIRQAERLAEYQVPLDWSIVGRANVENSQVQNADYLTTLKISERAAATRDEILKTVKQSLEAEIKLRRNATEKGRQAVSSAIQDRELCKKRADEEIDLAEERAEREAEATINRNSPDHPTSKPLLVIFWAGVLGSALCCALSDQGLVGDVTGQGRVINSLALGTLLGVLVFVLSLVFSYLVWGLKWIHVREEAYARSNETKNAVTVKHTQELAAAENKLKKSLPALQSALARAQAQEQKAKHALSLIDDITKLPSRVAKPISS